MGKKDKKKEKKLKGAVKTAAKTEKNALKRMKKEFSTKGEDLDAIIASVQEEERKRNLVVENVTESLTIRSGLSLSVNSEKDELIFFGGEYFNGSKTTMYNELYTYNIKKDKWLQISSPNGPLPRCSHQAVFVPQMGGQLWVFGGEFSSPTHSQFRHYSDLWVFHFNEKTWEQIKASGGPSSRSGHRMTLSQKKLFVFGGFHESVRDYKYFNDVYTFDLENRKWSKIEAKSNPPSPRSGCQIAPLSDGGILIYGGYSREKIKRDIDKGTVHSDMYLLQPDKKQSDLETAANANTVTKWKWVQVKQSGSCPSPRCGFSMTLIPNANKVVLFGGVFDVEESEESIQGQFFNDLYQLELDIGKWSKIQLRGSGEIKSKRRRKVKEDGDGESDAEGEIEDPTLEPKVESMTIEDKEQVVADDGIFVVKMGPSISSNDGMEASQNYDEGAVAPSSVKAFSPHPRMNSCLVAKSGMLYLFGGTYEDGDRQLTLADFYTLDLKKLDEWKTLVAMDAKTQEWLESDSSGESGSGSEDDNDEEDDDKSDSTDEDMEVDKEGDQTR